MPQKSMIPIVNGPHKTALIFSIMLSDFFVLFDFMPADIKIITQKTKIRIYQKNI